MIAKKSLSIRVASASIVASGLWNGFLPVVASAVRPVERVDIEEVLWGDGEWYRPDRQYRCIFLYEAPARPDSEFKICAYDCLGYGAAATFPWPASLPCPGSFNTLFPPIPDGYPSPYSSL